jgi:hypothetical protein
MVAFVFLRFFARHHSGANLNGIPELASIGVPHYQRLTDFLATVIVRAVRNSGMLQRIYFTS